MCQALAATGLAGRPEEYFEARRATGAPRSAADYFGGAAFELGRVPLTAAPDYSSLVGIEDYRDHLAAVLERGTGPNGVFGAKLMWGHVDDFTAFARTLPELEHADLGDILAALVGDVDYVWCAAAARCARRSPCGARSRPRPGAPMTGAPSDPRATASTPSTIC